MVHGHVEETVPVMSRGAALPACWRGNSRRASIHTERRMSDNTTLLVAGAGGFMGTHLLQRLAGRPGVVVRAAWHRRQPRVSAANIAPAQADLRRAEDCARITEGVDHVILAAGRLSTAAVLARNPLGPITENTIINTQLLEAAWRARVKKFLWLGSTTAYPPLDRELVEDDLNTGEPPASWGAVGWTSRYMEALCRLYALRAAPAMTTIVLRPTSIYGEHDDFDFTTCHAFPAMMRRVVERMDPIPVWGTGEDRRDQVHAADVVEACLLALERVEGHDAFNIGAGQSWSVNELLRMTLEIDGYDNARIEHQGGGGGVFHRRFDCSRAARVLGFTPTTGIREGIRRTVAWYREGPGRLVSSGA